MLDVGSIRRAVALRSRARRLHAAISGTPYVTPRLAPRVVSLDPRIPVLDMAPLRPRGFASQFGQDVILDRFFSALGLQEGVFVDVGAHDGVSFSNTLFFERQRWTGVCIEPLAEPFRRLRDSRTARCINCAVGDVPGEAEFIAVTGYSEMLSGLVNQYDARHLARIEQELAEEGGSRTVVNVPVRRLDDILEECGIRRVDFLSVDVEGGELGVLRSLDFSRTPVLALAIENDYRDDAVARYLAERSGLRRVLRIDVDDIYVDLTLLAAYQSPVPT